jgi:hypothetical protein
MLKLLVRFTNIQVTRPLFNIVPSEPSTADTFAPSRLKLDSSVAKCGTLT